jgi:hypothetical protein
MRALIAAQSSGPWDWSALFPLGSLDIKRPHKQSNSQG